MSVGGEKQDDLILLNASGDTDEKLRASEYERMLQYLHALVFDSALPKEVPGCLCAHPRAEEVRRVLEELRNALKMASRGDFAYKVTTRGFLSGTLKALQSHLNHMAWLTRRMADGDLEQRMDFMGEIAVSFNAMADQLSRTLAELKQREERLELLTADLRHEVEVRRDAEDKLRREEERWQLAVRCSRDGIWDVNLETEETPYYSPRLVELTGIRLEKSPGIRDWEKLLHPDDHEALDIFHAFFGDGEIPESFAVDHRLLCGDGKYRWFMTRGMTVMNPETHRPARLIGVTADIQERKEREEFFSYRATHDALTGLPNRTLFDERLEKGIEFALQNDSHLAVIMVDLDNFKVINDTMGHHAGDALLVEIASRLRKSLRGSDTVSRFGGDEFALLFFFGKNEWHSITRMLERMMSSLQRPVRIEEKKFIVTASFGVCICPEDGNNPRQLLKRADEAMYHAKAQGRNACAFWKANRQFEVVKFERYYRTGGEREGT